MNIGSVKFKLWTIIGLTVVFLLLTGCTSQPAPVEADDATIETDNTVTPVLNKNRMSPADWEYFYQEAGNALLNSPLLEKYLIEYKIEAEKRLKEEEAAGVELSTREKLTASKPLLMFGMIENNTSEHLDSRILLDRLCELLLNSGKMRVATYAAREEQSIDNATFDARQLKKDSSDRKSTAMKKDEANVYDLSLAGTIIKQSSKDDRGSELSYILSLAIANVSTNEIVWSFTKQIKRQQVQSGPGL